jgi:hypothetical protein
VVIGTIVAIASGLFCGYLNLWVLVWAGERLARTGESKTFALSSFFRVGVLAIIAAAFAAAGPWWLSLVFIAATFVPLAFHAAGVVRGR